MEAHHQQYCPISMNEVQLPKGILPPAGWDQPEPSWFDFTWCTCMAIDKLSINDVLTHNLLGTPPPDDTPNEDPINPQQPDLTCTSDATKTKTHREVVGVQNAGGKAYGKATGLYNKHWKYIEQWNLWHPFLSTHDLQLAQLFSQQPKTRIDQHVRRGLDNVNTESKQLADAVRQLLFELDFWLGNTSLLGDESHIFRRLYHRDIFKCIQVLFTHHPFHAHHDFELVRLAVSEGR